ncbi:MAG: type III secretion system stator protein SctL [Puniceicoccales bacterium]|jgi:type III secretion protein L|nr:type III secretion system stator protein SctL [Puniceicoccales bacterium]
MIWVLNEKREMAIVPGKRILRAEEFLAVRGSLDLIAEAEKAAVLIVSQAKERAKEIVAQAQKEAAQLAAKAKDAHEEERKKGFDAGMVEGKSEMAARLIELAKKEAACQVVLEETVCNIIVRSIRRIIGEMDDEERVRRIVRTALAVVRNRKRVVVRVHPDQADGARKAVGGDTDQVKAGDSRPPIEVIADGRLEKDSCIIDTELGSVDAGLEAQLAAVCKILKEV